jgi:cathepsin B
VACPAGDWACVAREIHAHGSIAVTFGTVHDDFYAHKTGIYRVADAALGRSGLGDHATKLIGWGFDDETKDPYWLMMNSWANWGEDGVGKVGVGEMNLEGEAVGVQM